MSLTNEEQITTLIRNWVKAVNARDIEATIAHHTPEILLFDVPGPLQTRGIEAYKESWTKLFFPWYGDDGAFEVKDLEIIAGDDTAFCHGIIHCSGTDDEKKVSLEVRLTMGLKKIDGQWTVTHEHHSEPSV